MGPKRVRTRPASSTTLDQQPEPTSVEALAPATVVDEEILHDDEEDILTSGSEAERGVNIDDRNTIEDDDDDDPITREYDVFLNDGLLEKLMLLQYPTRDPNQPDPWAKRVKPSELRWKPRAGMLEVDLPMEIFDNCDREKAARWGDALKNSTEARAGGSLGLAGGFGIGSIPTRIGGGGRASRKDEDDSALGKQPGMLLANYISANSLGRVLNKQILGGQIIPIEDEKPIYMLGAFEDDQLHLTPIDCIAQLRPQFHHLDAEQEQIRSSQRAQREAGNPPRQQESRAIHMTVKSADGEDIDITGTANTLKAAQEENWTHLDYIHDHTEEAWATYRKLYLKDAVNAPKLESSMKHDEFLDAISASKMETRRPAKKSVGGKDAREDHGPDKPKSASSKVS